MIHVETLPAWAGFLRIVEGSAATGGSFRAPVHENASTPRSCRASSPGCSANPLFANPLFMSPIRSAGSVVVLFSTVLLLSACQDPSGVGLELIGEEGQDPNVVVIAADTVLLGEADEITGGFGDGSSPAQGRVLVGTVTDPLFGDASAEAYLDVGPPASVPNGFRDRTITSATLRLARDYVYGDSTQTLSLALYQMARDWDPTGAQPDTSFEVGALLDTFEIAASDSLLELDLPSSWVDANDEFLRSDTVLTAVDGFQLRLADGTMTNAIIGFATQDSELRLATAEDTVSYSLREVFTHIERGAASMPPPDILFVRDGIPEVAVLTFDYEALEGLALARGLVRLNVDPDALESSSSFARSLPETLALFGITETDARFGIATAAFSEETNSYMFANSSLTSILQDVLLGNQLFERFEIESADSPASLAVLPLVLGPPPGEGESDTRPRVALTVIPTN